MTISPECYKIIDEILITTGTIAAFRSIAQDDSTTNLTKPMWNECVKLLEHVIHLKNSLPPASLGVHSKIVEILANEDSWNAQADNKTEVAS